MLTKTFCGVTGGAPVQRARFPRPADGVRDGPGPGAPAGESYASRPRWRFPDGRADGRAGSAAARPSSRGQVVWRPSVTVVFPPPRDRAMSTAKPCARSSWHQDRPEFGGRGSPTTLGPTAPGFASPPRRSRMRFTFATNIRGDTILTMMVADTRSGAHHMPPTRRAPVSAGVSGFLARLRGWSRP